MTILKQKKILIETLDNDDKIIAYELSNGERSTRDIEEHVNVSFNTVSRWWNKWFEEGLMEQTAKYGGSRYKRLCSLTKLGIKIPETLEDEDDE